MSPIYLCSLVTVSTVNNLVATDDDDPTETAKDTIASRVTQESKQLNGMPGCSETILYNYRIALDVALGQNSSTLKYLLSRISHKRHRTCQGALMET